MKAAIDGAPVRPRMNRGLRGAAALAARQTDLALALLLVAIVALFVLPLPTALMDLLIASNLAVSLVLLIVAMYVPSALSLSTFPSLLLFTTLFRLALNIASTKLILLHADAGRIIDTFGKLIVGNNVVVGGVVFLIIAIVQFIVIAKGSERVAEVAARFALDAMPGKQMSIDAELRSGALSSAEAQARRRALEQESQLHGAMDGAMKFVKGDAIAGIVIALVNILAGVAVGSLMHGMSLGQALQRYSILTVGDGMVSQIPSLLVSIAAGIVITRVSSADERDAKPLAAQILEQVAAHPRALLIAAAALSAFLLVPGFPKWAFGAWVAIVAALGLATLGARRRGRTPAWISHAPAPRPGDAAGADAVTHPVALRLAPAVHAGLDLAAFDRTLVAARQRAERELGPVYPQVRVAADGELGEGRFEVTVQDVAVAAGNVPAAGPDAGIGELVERVDAVCRRHAAQLIGLQDVQRLLQSMQQQIPDVVAEVQRSVPPQRVAETLRRLLQEGVPVRNLRVILESLLRWAPQESDGIALAELVRTDLGRWITSRHVGADRRLPALLLDNALLDRLVAAVERSPRGNLLLLEPALRQRLIEDVQRAAARAPANAALVVSTDVRRYVRTLLDATLPRLPVLSFQELDEDVVIVPAAWIENPDALPRAA